jgi:hypothetical protein
MQKMTVGPMKIVYGPLEGVDRIPCAVLLLKNVCEFLQELQKPIGRRLSPKWKADCAAAEASDLRSFPLTFATVLPLY